MVFAVGYLFNRWVGVPQTIAGPCALIASSHFFALALGTLYTLLSHGESIESARQIDLYIGNILKSHGEPY
ncbi:hypothetical protein Thiowin_01921 [Thiorhodovibrio winogradskyi]|uniref:Uncharacterized protein n=1 Tax=Thiorhodovibrio winogradskyi TaxID=77007 RepID=A0ABZ0S7J7_9GAMM